MELALIIWAVGTLPSVAMTGCFIAFILVLVGFGSAALAFCVGNESTADEDDKELCSKVAKVGKRVGYICLVLWIFFLLVPDKKTSYQMLAGYGVQTLAENDKVQEVASDGVEVLQALMKKAKTELEK